MTAQHGKADGAADGSAGAVAVAPVDIDGISAGRTVKITVPKRGQGWSALRCGIDNLGKVDSSGGNSGYRDSGRGRAAGAARALDGDRGRVAASVLICMGSC